MYEGKPSFEHVKFFPPPHQKKQKQLQRLICIINGKEIFSFFSILSKLRDFLNTPDNQSSSVMLEYHKVLCILYLNRENLKYFMKTHLEDLLTIF